MEMRELRKKGIAVIVGIILCLTNLISLSTAYEITDFTSKENIYFPADEWRTSSPEEQNMNSTKLDSMYQTISSQDIGIDSIHIIRNGYLVYEKYYEYYSHLNFHQMFSTTKSIISTLIGIANASGFITNLDEPVLGIFPERTFLNEDARKQALTIRHLLKMQSGLQWNENDVPMLNETVATDDYDLFTNLSDTKFLNWNYNSGNDWYQMVISPDWVQFVLDKPMVADPGTTFYYITGVSHVLSAIIHRKTGMNTEAFAQQYLFTPLGLTNYLWFNDSMDISMGGDGLWLQPFDMTKIGYLFLNNGNWNGSQIIPSSWIEESTQDYNPSPGSLGYGYQWWVNSEGYYHTWGFGCQHIIVSPDKNLVVAITASEYHDSRTSLNIFRSFILKSIDVQDTTTAQATTDGYLLWLLIPSVVILIILRKQGKKN
jgi:CubicO group peptidase (beta-lactamase class C family)